jgi:NADPH:quinone reductase
MALSAIEEGRASDSIGRIRNFDLTVDGNLREQLLWLSDTDHKFSYLMLNSPMPVNGGRISR